MLSFNYTAIDARGQRQSGVLQANSEGEVVNILRDRGLIVIRVALSTQLNLGKYLRNLRGVSLEDKVIFTRQFATMISSGLPITQALLILREQSRNPTLKAALSDITNKVEGGSSLHEALRAHPEVFDQLFLSMVRAGEASGNLDKILSRLADTMAAESDFKGKAKSAMIYPMIIFFVMMGVVTVMLVFVIPRLKELYEDLGAELPFVTKLLLQTSGLIVDYWWLFLLFLAGLVVAYRRLATTKRGRHIIDGIKFRLPVFGSLLKEVQLTSFTRTLSMMIASGIPILDSLEIARDTLSNVFYNEAVLEAEHMIEKGRSISDSFRYTGMFPPILPEMMSIGEETGKLDEVLDKISLYFENQSNNMITGLSGALEPVIMVILGIMVGFLMISLILPIYSLTSQF